MTEDRLLRPKEAAQLLAESVATLRRRTDIPRVAKPTAKGKRRKVVYLYRLSTLHRLMGEWEEKAS